MTSSLTPARSSRVRTGTAAVGLVSVLVLSACGGGSSTTIGAGGDRPTVTVSLTDKGCDLDRTTIPAGPVTVTIKNTGTSKVTGVALVAGERTLAEKERIAPGGSGAFTLTVKEGSYALRCLGGSPQDQPVTVTRAQAGATGASTIDDSAEQAAAAAAYAEYVRGQVAQQVTATKALTDAVRKGNLAAAAAAYPAARVNYERIEPVSESFDDLDPRLDARIADVEDVAGWTGYHRLEKAIFADKSLAGMAAVAQALQADVFTLQSLVQTVSFTASDLANGAGSLLDEIGKSKITGEEEAYSHIDFVDFQGNVDGARRAFDLLTPALQKRDATLVTTITERFAALDKALSAYRTGSGPTDFHPYSAVPVGQHRVLANLVDALAAPMSQVGGLLVRK
jgi:iron uptake system component EfeO